MFLDEGIFEFRSGAGGDGMKSFRAEPYVPRGGPDGGNGGRGGNVYLVASSHHHTLFDIDKHHLMKAENGTKGGTSRSQGANGKDLYVRVPVGTLIYDFSTNELIYDLCKAEETYLLCEGGKGGKGNNFFKSSLNPAPTRTTQGEPGKYLKVRLELKLMADCALVGFPNAGKSSFIRKISSATPKVADYPFTTLAPHLGVVKPQGKPSFVVADIPGLIEGAAEGKGLGNQFLKHIERCQCLAFVLDVSNPNWWEEYLKLDGELQKYGSVVQKRPRILLLNKIDLLDPSDSIEIPKEAPKHYKISSLVGQGIPEAIEGLSEIIEPHLTTLDGW